MKNKILQGDCLDILKTIPDESVYSIVTDPPYELGFMGKSWDNTGIAYNVDMWKECLRVLKPGGHLLAFSGTRTYHRMAVAIEDAGFEVRDMIEWVYGSGFSKCTVWSEGAKRNSDRLNKENDLMVENGWQGWGRGGLKPAHEPICMARKPLAEKTVAENVLKYGTGGINIDESRVEYTSEKDKKEGQSARPSKTSNANEYALNHGGLEGMDRSDRSDITGRFPANLILTFAENEYIIKDEITNEQKQNALKWIYENA
jgi:site-specific DNA-methyltransferase (adenine-specific)